ncbi:MAG: transcriptional regulator [Lysobacteraceae bacterium]|nr:MAG: transcriptional regulator [Xanthomonadaceae bacterium]
MDALSQILSKLRFRAGLFTHARYCGTWAVDTSGMKPATFHLVQDGDCWLRLGDQAPRRLMRGDFVLFPRDEHHLLTSTEAIPDVPINIAPPEDPALPLTRMLCGYFEFTSPAAWPLLASLPAAIVVQLVGDGGATEVGHTIELLIRESLEAKVGSDVVLERLAYVLFVQVLRREVMAGRVQGLLAALGDRQLGVALQKIHSEPAQPWTMNRLAREAGMGRANFAKRFNEAVGVPPMRYLTEWRMQLAVDQLSTTEQSVAQIAEQCGYQSEAAFRAAFKKVLGYPPGRLRSRP